MSLRSNELLVSAAICIAAVLFFAGCAAPVVVDRTVTSSQGMVVCVDDLAAEVGARVLAAGGNAIDAAVAVGFTLAVTHPQAGNLGGGGFMVIRLSDGTVTTIDYREKAPKASTPGMFLDRKGAVDKIKRDLGLLSSGVPGTPAGLELAHRRYGRLPWRILVEPARVLAEEGFEVDDDLASALKRHAKKLRLFESTRQCFFNDEGQPPQPGDRLEQPLLAETLSLIQQEGAAGFYHGRTARNLIAAVDEGEGIMTLDDLASYNAIERKPVTGVYRALTVVGMPLPSSGGTILIELLNILSGFDLNGMDEAARCHILAEGMRLAFRDRALYLGDADFVDTPSDRLLTEEHARTLRARIDRAHATDSHSLSGDCVIHAAPSEKAETDSVKAETDSVKAETDSVKAEADSVKAEADSVKAEADSADNGHDEGRKQTTHFSIMDREGNMVSNTYTLEQTFGCKAVAGSTGVLMNNEMHDFNVRPGWTADDGSIGTAPNLIAPGKRMLSSMCPIILLKDGQPLAVIGSPGGRTIINTVLQVLTNLVDLGLCPEEAVAAPRIHHQWFPDRLYVEKNLSHAIKKELEARGHTIKERDIQGDCHIIVVDPRTGEMKGVADQRLDGWAAAPR